MQDLPRVPRFGPDHDFTAFNRPDVPPVRRDEPGIYDDLIFEPPAVSPSFWKGIAVGALIVGPLWLIAATVWLRWSV